MVFTPELKGWVLLAASTCRCARQVCLPVVERRPNSVTNDQQRRIFRYLRSRSSSAIDRVSLRPCMYVTVLDCNAAKRVALIMFAALAVHNSKLHETLNDKSCIFWAWHMSIKLCRLLIMPYPAGPLATRPICIN